MLGGLSLTAGSAFFIAPRQGGIRNVFEAWYVPQMANTLTPRQKKILQLLSSSTKRPSIRDLAEQVGASNPMSIQSDLTALYERGYISKDRRLKRRSY